MTAYLESSNELNNPLYERYGFEIVGEEEVVQLMPPPPPAAVFRLIELFEITGEELLQEIPAAHVEELLMMRLLEIIGDDE